MTARLPFCARATLPCWGGDSPLPHRPNRPVTSWSTMGLALPPLLPGTAPPGGLAGIQIDPSSMLVAIVILFALVGFRLGIRRQAVALVFTGIVYWLADTHYPQLARPLARLPYLRGESAQLLLFGLGVLGAHAVGRQLAGAPAASGLKMLSSLPSLLERIMGLGLGGATGYLVGRFSLLRIPSGAVTIVGPRPQVQELVEAQAPNALWLTIGVLILFGVMSLKPKKKKG